MVATGQEKVSLREKINFSRSEKSQGIFILFRENGNHEKSQGKVTSVRENWDFMSTIIVEHQYAVISMQ